MAAPRLTVRRFPVRLSTRMCVLFLQSLAVLVAAADASAAEEVRFNQVELRAEVTREVTNDLMSARLSVEAHDSSPAGVAATLNRATAEAIAAAAAADQVKAQSGQTYTYPVYDRDQRLIGWRGRADVRVESRNFQAIAQLAAKLQPAMQLGGIEFSISPEERRKVESELITEAVDAFRARALIAQRALGGNAYRIRRITLDGGGTPPPRPFVAARAAPAGMAAEAPPPVFEGGETRVQMTATGLIEVE
jgi:predicted secreted protein